MSEGFDELLVHLPWFVGRCDHSDSILFFEHLLLVLCKRFSKFCEVGPGSPSCAFLFLFFPFENLLDLIHVNDGRRESLGHVKCHS